MVNALKPLEDVLNDARLLDAESRWNDFLSQAAPNDTFAIVHHGDLDGVIGGAYASAFLKKHFEGAKPAIYWVGTEEYDFTDLRKWVKETAPVHCLIFDISIVNNPDALETIAASVSGKVFIFDHHLINSSVGALPANVVLANPTPAPLPKNVKPVPTFMFALKLAQKKGLHFPDWLAVLVMFTEGVDSFFPREIEALASTVPEMSAHGDLRKRYRNSPLARTATLVRAAYSTDAKDDLIVSLLDDLATGRVVQYADFHGQMESRFRRAADSISSQISELVDQWSRKLSEGNISGPLVTIFIQGPHAVAGPVASIIRGHNPSKVIMAWIEHGPRAVIELRTGNDMPTNLVSLLESLSGRILLLNYGGHAHAAGATVNRSDIERFIEELSKSADESYRANGLI